MRFTKEEQKELERLGLQIINQVCAIQDGWVYQIEIKKTDLNEFNVNIDANVDENDYDYDLIETNQNITETEISFDKVVELLQEGYLE